MREPAPTTHETTAQKVWRLALEGLQHAAQRRRYFAQGCFNRAFEAMCEAGLDEVQGPDGQTITRNDLWGAFAYTAELTNPSTALPEVRRIITINRPF